MPFLYGYLQFNPVLTKGFCWSFITLNVSLFIVLYVAQIHKIKTIITQSFHAQIICNFLSSTALFVTILIYSYYPSVFIINHKLLDFTTFPYIGIGVLTTFNATLLLLSYLNIHYNDIQTLYPEIYYGCFVLFYTESCIQCLYFLYLVMIVLTDYVLGMKWMHKPFDADSIPLTQQILSSTHPLNVDFIKVDPFTMIGMTILPGRTKGRYNRDLQTDIQRLKNELNVNVLVTLIPNDELIRCECEEIVHCANQNGLQILHFPWRDKFIPTEIQSFHHFICRLQQYYQANQRMVIHCNGGVGRTGTTVACLLMKTLKDNDSTPNDICYASRLMREARRSVMLRNPLQRCFVRTYYHHFCK